MGPVLFTSRNRASFFTFLVQYLKEMISGIETSVSSLEDIKRQFSGANLSDDVLSECEAMCQSFSLTAQDLYIKWQRFVINNYGGNSSVQITRDRLLQLRQEIQKEFSRKIQAKTNSGLSARVSQGNRLSKNRNRVYDKSSIDSM